MQQEERRANTRAAIIAAATEQFGHSGFEATRMDDIAHLAGVAKGAVYHHFKSKRELFEAAFDAASSGLAKQVVARTRQADDAVETLISAIETYFRLCADPSIARITLRDAPGVLGYERWRELDALHFGGLVTSGLTLAMQAGAIREHQVEPLAKMFLAAIQTAALDCASRDDFDAAAAPYLTSLNTMLNGFRSLR